MKSLEDLLRFFQIKANDWDIIIIGDGSGTVWNKAFGWGSIMIDRLQLNRELFYGVMNTGTSSMGELLAVLHPLIFLSANNKGIKSQGLRVHVISDSMYVVNGLKHTNPIWVSKLRKHRELWMAIHMTRRRGLTIHSYHIKRDLIDLQKFCHELANMSRRSLEDLLSELKITLPKE